MRVDEVLRMLKVPPMEAQLAVDKLRLATQIETSQQALALVVSSAGAEWREELTQAMELVAEVMKEKLASLPRPHESPHMWEEFWNKWSVGCTAEDLSGTRCGRRRGVWKEGAECLDQEQGWLCTRCGKWFLRGRLRRPSECSQTGT